MRHLFSLTITLLLVIICKAQSPAEPCPPDGSATTEIGKRVNVLKNRDIKPDAINPNIVIDSILKGMPEDTGRYKITDYATISGYVLGADDAGPESCNCFSRDSAKHNTILYIGHSLESAKDSVFAVEITYKFKAANRYLNVDALFGKQVTITGLMMYNFEMKKSALNANKKARSTDRKTAWEICPVTDIIVQTGAKK